jgi:hypothetical protein
VASKFQRGSGCYACRSCGRLTRATGGGDNEHIRLCSECYELGGIENEILDGIADKNDPEVKRRVKALADFIRKKKGTPKFYFEEMIGEE